MTYPKTRQEFKNFAGKWTQAVLDLNDYPEDTKFIVGREDLPGLPFPCIFCKKDTQLSSKDSDVLKQGAVVICSSCYLKHLKKE